MSLSDVALLEQYKLARDAIVTAIATDRGVVRYKIGMREVERFDPARALAEIEELIRYYERKTSAASEGLAVSYARRVRPNE